MPYVYFSTRFDAADVFQKLKDIYIEYPRLLEEIIMTLSSKRFRSIRNIKDCISIETERFLSDNILPLEKILELKEKEWIAADTLLFNQDQKYILMAYRNHLKRKEDRNKWKSQIKS